MIKSVRSIVLAVVVSTFAIAAWASNVRWAAVTPAQKLQWDIDKCYSSEGGTVMMPRGTIETDQPIRVYSCVKLTGDFWRNTHLVSHSKTFAIELVGFNNNNANSCQIKG